MSEFRGLAHVVEVWRAHRDEQDWVTMPDDLYDVLEAANDYMTEVEQQQPINVALEVAHTDQDWADRRGDAQANNHEPGPTCSDECGHDDTSNSDGLLRRTTPMFDGDLSPVGLLPERLCGLPTKHLGHDWSAESTKDVFTYWCNGVAGVPPGV